MSENLKKFVEIVSKDAELAKKLSTTKKEELGEKIKLAISIAKEKGIELIENDFLGMSENDLKAAAGGYESPSMEPMGGGDNGIIFLSPFVIANVNVDINASTQSVVNSMVNIQTVIAVMASVTATANVSVHD